MDAFVNDLDPYKFSRTNSLWNQFMLNDPWSVGYVSSLILLKSFGSKEEWETFYYEMGRVRQDQLARLSSQQAEVLRDYQLIRTNRTRVTSLPWEVKNINTQNGRTQEELRQKGRFLYQKVREIHADISEEDCIKAVRFRVICETWNGVVLREKNTVKSLREQFPQFRFETTSGEHDHQFAVDYEVFLESELICGIQIKPKSYLGNTPYLQRAKTANTQKFENYYKEQGVSVFVLISEMNGQLLPYKGYEDFQECLKEL